MKNGKHLVHAWWLEAHETNMYILNLGTSCRFFLVAWTSWVWTAVSALHLVFHLTLFWRFSHLFICCSACGYVQQVRSKTVKEVRITDCTHFLSNKPLKFTILPQARSSTKIGDIIIVNKSSVTDGVAFSFLWVMLLFWSCGWTRC